MMKILVRGAYGESNFGDDALMCALENFFVLNNLSSDLLFAATMDSTYCNKLLKQSKFKNIINADIEATDLIVYGGGTQFYSFGKRESWIGQVIARLKLLKLKDWTKIGKIAAIRKYDKNRAAIGVGLGPFNLPEPELERFKKLVNNFNFLAVRDDVSYKYCVDWDAKNLILGADICFSDYFQIDQHLLVPVPKNKKKIGVIVRDWIHDEEGGTYRDPLIDVIAGFKEQYDFVYIVFAEDRDPKWVGELKRVKEDVLIWDPENDTIEGFLNTLAGFDGFITARYHGAVFASLLNRPTICIEIEPKLRILSEQVPEFALWKKPFDKNSLKESFNLFEESSFNCSKSVAELRTKSNNMFDLFHQYIQRIS